MPTDNIRPMPEDQGSEEEKWRGQYSCSSEPVRIGLSLTESHEIVSQTALE